MTVIQINIHNKNNINNINKFAKCILDKLILHSLSQNFKVLENNM